MKDVFDGPGPRVRLQRFVVICNLRLAFHMRPILGTFVQSATILLSGTLDGFHFDMNDLVMEQQDDSIKVRRSQFAKTLSISHPVGRPLRFSLALQALLFLYYRGVQRGYFSFDWPGSIRCRFGEWRWESGAL
jgi:hypothetical protein